MKSGLYAKYEYLRRNQAGFREYVVSYSRDDGAFSGFELVAAAHGQRGIDAAYAVADIRAQHHGLRLERVTRTHEEKISRNH